MLLKMSISSSILIILIIILRSLAINKLPKKVFVLLWNIAILRLVIPFDLPIHYGITSPITKIMDSSIRHSNVTSSPAVMETSKKTVTDTVNLSSGNITWPTVVWGIGTLILLVIFGVLYWQEYKKIQTALPVSEETDNYFRSVFTIPKRVKLLTSDRIFTPLAFGILSPKIIFSKIWKASNELEIKYILAHEVIHIKRFDNLWKIIVLIVVGIHWFNPFVWIMYTLFNRDTELSCDEKVVALLGENQKKAYITALVKLAEKQHKWSFISNGFGENAIQERVVALMRFKRTTCISIGCAVFLLAGAITVFAQNGSKTISSAQPTAESSRITKKELSNEARKIINSCNDERWYVLDSNEYQYVYFNGLSSDYAYQPEIYADSQSGTIRIFDIGSSARDYVLLKIDRNVLLKIFYNNSQVTYTKLSV